MSGILAKISTKTTIYIISIVVSIAALILLESWPGARAITQHIDQSLGIANLNWAMIISSLIMGFLLGLIIKRKG